MKYCPFNEFSYYCLVVSPPGGPQYQNINEKISLSKILFLYFFTLIQKSNGNLK